MAETDEDPNRRFIQKLRDRLASDPDFELIVPPRTMVDSAAWDRYWQDQLDFGLAGITHMFCNDGWLVDVMRANGLRTVLCIGSGISQEPRALARSGFDVTALDLSPFAIEVASELNAPDEILSQLVGGRLAGAGGRVRFVTGDLCDPGVCPGPFDVVIERRTLQLFPDAEKPAAIRAAAGRVAPIGIFFSHSHRSLSPGSRKYPINDWFEAEGWPICERDKPLTGRTVAFFSSSG